MSSATVNEPRWLRPALASGVKARARGAHAAARPATCNWSARDKIRRELSQTRMYKSGEVIVVCQRRSRPCRTRRSTPPRGLPLASDAAQGGVGGGSGGDGSGSGGRGDGAGGDGGLVSPPAVVYESVYGGVVDHPPSGRSPRVHEGRTRECWQVACAADSSSSEENGKVSGGIWRAV